MSIGTVRGRAAAVRRQHFDYCTAAVDLYTGVVAGVVWQQCATIRPAAGGGDDGPRSTDAGAGQAEKAGVDERGGEQRTEARPSFAAVQFRIEHPGGGENQAQDHFQAEQAHLGQQEPRSTAANTDKHAGDDHHVQQGAADRRRGPLGQGLFRVEPAPANCRLFATSQPKRPDVPLNNTSMVLEVLPIRFQLPVVVVVVVVALSTINKQTNKQIIKTTSGNHHKRSLVVQQAAAAAEAAAVCFIDQPVSPVQKQDNFPTFTNHAPRPNEASLLGKFAPIAGQFLFLQKQQIESTTGP
ncbi:conserved hypothetical protein [Trichinella spiralis]|uniref:hypothetical protein n=1 Tax=Trichinella spiralis TaxID=6334 RepID=UPI0001EFC1C8|nr:conserved hypothetical protein [Trichinella spiralis]